MLWWSGVDVVVSLWRPVVNTHTGCCKVQCTATPRATGLAVQAIGHNCSNNHRQLLTACYRTFTTVTSTSCLKLTCTALQESPSPNGWSRKPVLLVSRLSMVCEYLTEFSPCRDHLKVPNRVIEVSGKNCFEANFQF